MSLSDEFLEWQSQLPLEITSDALWHCAAYKLGLFVADRAWPDLGRLASDPRSRHMADQLGRSLGSISANYAEAFSRNSIPDRCRLYEYSLGSARESRDRAFKARHIIGEARVREQIELLTRIIKLVTVTVIRERKRVKGKKRHPPSDE
ncbi:MAG: four helix bundle protein [Gemmatimonadaceae bacterium]